ncbi:glycosyl transferase family protein [Oceanicoccus sp. KOV_DT_Chl]|uniref:glycosyl transferase family protein n=1 Tax=Oceanicoccus sp. KOV_DT_Chl TaxID=1904639 RepID=UPI000C7AC31C|nr:glycosyl transferase family protein [Oceanicoccus sp. KOV_DT_Chl]
MSETYRKKLGQLKDNEHPFAQYVRILGKGKTGSRSLTELEAYDAMSMILQQQVEDIQLGAFLMLLRVKEESPDELTGFVRAVRDNIAAPDQIAVNLDWSSYAGKKRQLPWYLLSCFLLADQGIRIFMHGASGHTIGRLYTEQVLPELGVNTATDWQQVATQLDQQCFSFMPLDYLCPELKRIIDFRNYLGLRSPVHTLSRLINPLAADYSMQSIFHPAYADSHQQAAIKLGQTNAAVFKGEGGELERKPEASCIVKMVINGQAQEEIWPKLIEGRQAQPEQLDLRELKAVWRGKQQNDYAEQAIIGTTAIALKLLGKANTQKDCLNLARQYWQDRNPGRL